MILNNQEIEKEINGLLEINVLSQNQEKEIRSKQIEVGTALKKLTDSPIPYLQLFLYYKIKSLEKQLDDYKKELSTTGRNSPIPKINNLRHILDDLKEVDENGRKSYVFYKFLTHDLKSPHNGFQFEIGKTYSSLDVATLKGILEESWNGWERAVLVKCFVPQNTECFIPSYENYEGSLIVGEMTLGNIIPWYSSGIKPDLLELCDNCRSKFLKSKGISWSVGKEFEDLKWFREEQGVIYEQTSKKLESHGLTFEEINLIFNENNYNFCSGGCMAPFLNEKIDLFAKRNTNHCDYCGDSFVDIGRWTLESKNFDNYGCRNNWGKENGYKVCWQCDKLFLKGKGSMFDDDFCSEDCHDDYND